MRRLRNVTIITIKYGVRICPLRLQTRYHQARSNRESQSTETVRLRSVCTLLRSSIQGLLHIRLETSEASTRIDTALEHCVVSLL